MNAKNLLPPLLLCSACALHRPPEPAPLPTMAAPVVHAPITVMPAQTDEVSPLLAYHQSLRKMTQGELIKEISGLSLQQKSPKNLLQSGMALMLTRSPGDLARAQAQFDAVAGASEAEAAPLKPLAQLLSSYCTEQRRLADHADKLNAQLKEGQRKNEQLNDMLEALKAIERGLPVRPSSGPSAGVK
ncbi:hypothetical protein ACHMW6_26090 [Pseudoduganella sp. UC29_106]|uniref:hypothetical protein n=1 Tax=Pseudoduganella sp. UC29_106 TaxID=3374553 RepID=UPI003756F323